MKAFSESLLEAIHWKNIGNVERKLFTCLQGKNIMFKHITDVSHSRRWRKPKGASCQRPGEREPGTRLAEQLPGRWAAPRHWRPDQEAVFRDGDVSGVLTVQEAVTLPRLVTASTRRGEQCYLSVSPLVRTFGEWAVPIHRTFCVTEGPGTKPSSVGLSARRESLLCLARRFS